MKKIKWLLIFWLFALFWIGSSFWYNFSTSILQKSNINWWILNTLTARSYSSAYPNRWYFVWSNFRLSVADVSHCTGAYYTWIWFIFEFWLWWWFRIYSACWDPTYTWLFMTSPPLNYIPTIDNVIWEGYINYNNLKDVYPLVYDDQFNYFTLIDDSTLTFNWVEYPFDSSWNFARCIYWYSNSFSCIYQNSQTDFQYFYFVNNYWSIEIRSWYFVAPISWSDNTLIFTTDSANRLIYNLLDWKSDSNLESLTIVDKWYVDINSLAFFNRALFNTWWNFWSIVFLTNNSWSIYFNTNRIKMYQGWASMNSSIMYAISDSPLTFVSNSSVSDILSDNKNEGWWVYGYYWIFWWNSLYYDCVVNSDTWDSAICLNSDWSLKSESELMNCYSESYIDMSDWWSEEFTEYFCINPNNWIIQSIDIISSWSWTIFVPCENDSCVFNWSFWSLWMSWYSVDFFENYLNTTWYFFKCPRPYDSKLTIRPKLITLLNWVDILLPINCWIAWFSYWKNILTFENSWHFVPNWPLLNFEWENRTLLYYFFDILISIWIVVFVWKIFYLFHK